MPSAPPWALMVGPGDHDGSRFASTDAPGMIPPARSVTVARIVPVAPCAIATKTRDQAASTRNLLPPRSLQPLVIFFAFGAELVDELRVGFERLRERDGEGLRVRLRIVDRHFDLERPEAWPPDLLRHLRGAAHRAA